MRDECTRVTRRTLTVQLIERRIKRVIFLFSNEIDPSTSAKRDDRHG